MHSVHQLELRRLVRAAYRTDAPDVLCFLEATPRPGDLFWYAAWATVLLIDLRTSDECFTWQAAAQLIGLSDASRMGDVLDLVRASNAALAAKEAEPPLLTAADFARIFKAH